MRIFIDTGLLVDAFERNPERGRALRCALEHGAHELVLSLLLVFELAGPLWELNAAAVATRTLNDIEQLPHVWFDSARLHSLEVANGFAAFQNGVAYQPVNPYVPTFLDTFVNPPPLVRGFIGYGLAQAVFDIRHGGGFNYAAQRQRHAQMYRPLIAEERRIRRQMSNRVRARRELLRRKIAERIVRERVCGDNQGLAEEAAEHIVGDCHACPGLKLSFAMFHAVVDNLGDDLQDGDLADLVHAWAMPYVDRFTTDRRMADYVARADRVLGTNYRARVTRAVPDVIEAVEDQQT